MSKRSVHCYACLIAVVCRNEVFFSNRAAAFLSAKQYVKALQDARRVIALKPKWAKGHARLAAAHFAMQDFSEVGTNDNLLRHVSCCALSCRT